MKNRSYQNLEEEALDRCLWRTRFGRVCGPVVKQTTELILIVKANEMYYFSNLFDKIFYMFRTGPLSIIRSISTPYIRHRYLSC